MITPMILDKVPPDKSAEAERLWSEECGALLMEQQAVKASNSCVAGRILVSSFRLAPE